MQIFFRRLMASIIYSFVIILLLAFIQFISGMRSGIFFYILMTLFFWSGFAYQDSSVSQGTVGKQAMNIAITDLNGNRIPFARETKRFAGKTFASMPFLQDFADVLREKTGNTR